MAETVMTLVILIAVGAVVWVLFFRAPESHEHQWLRGRRPWLPTITEQEDQIYCRICGVIRGA